MIYNYDCQKAIFRLTERCFNLSPVGLDVKEFVTDDSNKKDGAIELTEWKKWILVEV